MEFLNNKIMQTNPNPTQPMAMLTALLNAIQSELSATIHNTPNLKIQPTTLCQQVIESGDNSAMLSLAITFNAPDTNDACDFAMGPADAIARYELYNWFKRLAQYDPDCELKTNMLEPNAYNIYIHNCGLNYCNATLTITDCTLYLTCIYNQQ